MLPDEIISEILSPALTVPDERFAATERISPFATYSLSSSAYLLVCKAWLRVATPLLYRVVVLRSTSQANALEETLQDNPELGRFIKKLRVEGGYGPAMHTILQAAPNVQDLFVSLCIWSTDRTAGLRKGLALLNPRRVIIDDPSARDPPHNKQLDNLMQTLWACTVAVTCLTNSTFLRHSAPRTLFPPPQVKMLPREAQELLKIPENQLERLFPSSNALVQDLLAHKIPYERPSAHTTETSQYLSKDSPTCSDFDPTSLTAPPPALVHSLVEALRIEDQYGSVCCAHIPGHRERYPLWIVVYWAELRVVRASRKVWNDAVQALEARNQQNPSDSLALTILDRILRLPWYAGLRGFEECDVEGLANFCKPTAWFKTTEINQMLELLDEDEQLLRRKICVVPSDYTRDVIRAFNDDGLDYEDAPRYRKLRDLGEDSVNGRTNELTTVANVDGDHWVALIINFELQSVYYFDSLKRSINAELRAAYNWWINQHHATEFSWTPLPCLEQPDSHNCGLFAANRVAYYVNPNKYPLLDTEACADERLWMLEKILDRHESEKFQHISKGFSFTFPNTPPRTPPAAPMDLPLPSPMKGKVKRRVTDRAVGSPPASPAKKRPAKEKVVAAAKRGLQEMEALPQSERMGLFKFLTKETAQQKRKREEDIRAEAEVRAERRQQDDLEKARKKILTADEKREAAMYRKRQERERGYLADVKAGIRNEDFSLAAPQTKKRRIIVPNLQDIPTSDDIAELSRPARQIEKRYKDKHRTHKSGRKRKNEDQQRVYTNWKTPFLFKQILVAGRQTKDAGGLSSTAIVKYLRTRDRETFANLAATTVQGWFQRDDHGVKIWNPAVLEAAKVNGNIPGHDKGGRRGALSAHPEVVEAIKKRLTILREAGAALNLICVRAIIVATTQKMAPEVFEKRYADGSYFKVSDSYCRAFLRVTMEWSERKATKAAQHLPKNWEDVCERAALRRAYIIKKEDIPAELIVNSDQSRIFSVLLPTLESQSDYAPACYNPRFLATRRLGAPKAKTVVVWSASTFAYQLDTALSKASSGDACHS
ncbi:hypothetical protein R3P38DRAFT_3626103 [Favolaschia claudopus]|uniref:Ubiquitin-like protease family profile domain-containing protein n=1 Tax=Favolaschia claudopus TaxID=2862362 RepID=A0AAW0A1L6_9AGAR